VNIPDRPLVPSRQEVAYLAGRVRDELARSRELLPAEAVREYERSLALMESIQARDDAPPSSRPPASDDDLRFWLENMLCYHGYTLDEVQAVTGLGAAAITSACERLAIVPGQRPPRAADGPLVVLPYPGGRHPRIGFLEGAVHPQRETKLSVFTPWDASSYVVVDLPEAVFSNLGLMYLAHTHVPTIWERQKVSLLPLEWNRRSDGSFDIERRLPNGIAIGAQAVPRRDGVFMELWLTNGTSEPLTNLRVQNCVLLAAASGFSAQTNTNKVFQNPYVACRSEEGRRWIITAWERCFRPWGNAPCPCLHSDPRFPDCPPGQTVRLRGGLWFYEGDDLDAELTRLKASQWATGTSGD
jgi:hypothetical protein